MRHENNLNVTGYVGPAIFRWQSSDGSDVLVPSRPESYEAGHKLCTDDFNKAEKEFTGFVQSQIVKFN